MGGKRSKYWGGSGKMQSFQFFNLGKKNLLKCPFSEVVALNEIEVFGH